MISFFTILRRRPCQAGLRPGEVALTFDDGPNLKGNVTPDLLDVLDRHAVRAAFCLIGQQVRRNADVVRRMHASGHLLVNHTESHVHPVGQSFASLCADIESCDQAIGDALGASHYRSDYFRVPYGIVTIAARRVARRLRMQPLLISHYGWDTRVGPKNCRPVVDALLENAKQQRGGMYVLHDGRMEGDRRRFTTDALARAAGILRRKKLPTQPPPSSAHSPDQAWEVSAENRTWVPSAVDHIISELKSCGLKFVLPGANLAASPELSPPVR